MTWLVRERPKMAALPLAPPERLVRETALPASRWFRFVARSQSLVCPDSTLQARRQNVLIRNHSPHDTRTQSIKDFLGLCRLEGNNDCWGNARLGNLCLDGEWAKPAYLPRPRRDKKRSSIDR